MTSAFLLATGPLHAATGDDDETSSFGGDDHPIASTDANTAKALTGLAALGAPLFGTGVLGAGQGVSQLALAAVTSAGAGTATTSNASTSAAGTATTTSGGSDGKPGTTGTSTVPPPPKDDGSGLRTAGYIAGGVGIAGFVLFVVAGIGAKNAHDRLEEDCGTGQPCDEAQKQSDIEDGKMLQTAANIGLATGLTGLGLGVTLIVLGGRPPNDTTPATAVNGAIVGYAGRF